MPGSPPVEWVVRDALLDYREAEAAMEARAAAIAEGRALERVWLVEHPPLYTAGTSAREADLVAPERFRSTARGGAGNTPIMAPGSGWPT